jgi:hypothetical protein
MLFMALAPVTLTDQDDSIVWRWTTNGCYSVASAYECQFLGAMIRFQLQTFGGQRLSINVNFLPGWLCIIGC